MVILNDKSCGGHRDAAAHRRTVSATVVSSIPSQGKQ